MSRTAVLLAILFAASSLPLASQARSLREGDRVRVSLRHGPAVRHLVGGVAAVGRDTLFLDVEGQEARVAIPRAAIGNVEISRGQHSNAGRGALIGFGLGAVGGAAAGSMDFATCSGSCFPSSRGEMAAGAIVFGALGTAVGAVLGAATRSERWESAAMDR